MPLLGATTLDQSGTESNSNEEILYIYQISEAGASPSDGLISYIWTLVDMGLTHLQRFSLCILQP